MASFSKTFYFNFRRDHQKISNERRDYESVDEKSLSWLCPEKRQKKKSGSKGLSRLNVKILSVFCELVPSIIICLLKYIYYKNKKLSIPGIEFKNNSLRLFSEHIQLIFSIMFIKKIIDRRYGGKYSIFGYSLDRYFWVENNITLFNYALTIYIFTLWILFSFITLTFLVARTIFLPHIYGNFFYFYLIFAVGKKILFTVWSLFDIVWHHLFASLQTVCLQLPSLFTPGIFHLSLGIDSQKIFCLLQRFR